MLAEKEFQRLAEKALEELNRALGAAAEKHEFEPDFNAGALTIEFGDPPGRFVVSPNGPVRQIWVSALATSYKLDWDSSRGEFALGGTGQTLKELLGELIGRQLGEEVVL